MPWTRARIIQELRHLHKRGKELSYNRLARVNQALLSAAAYHFKSYRAAIEAAGLDYAQLIRRPRWTRARIIALIKSARRRGEALHWSAVTRRRDELGKAAFASLQPRLFASWQRALHAAGLDADEISRYRHWDRNTIAFDLRGRQRDGEPLNSGALQQEDPGLHAASVRHFGSYDAALRFARIDPERFRQRRSWTRADVVRAIKSAAASGQSVSDSHIRRQFPALYGAAVRLFGAFTAARRAAKVKFRRAPKTVKSH
jgi:hypothetical protein